MNRTYCCFVCFEEFSCYEDFKSHVLESHEEGRDYVKCPLVRCGAPVRDIPTHFKAHHPNEKMPKVPQKSAIVWRDLKTRKREKKARYKEGWHDSTKMNRKFKFRSSWEETMFQCLDLWDDVVAYEAEPFKIPYLYEGAAHNYTPDIFVHFVDGRKEVWEIKPEGQTKLERNKAKWHAARDACANRGWEFEVITETEIEKLKKHIRLKNLNENEL